MNGDAVPPADVLRQALLELGLGPQTTVTKTLQAYGQDRLSRHDVRLTLESLCWQSDALRRFYDFGGGIDSMDDGQNSDLEQLTYADMQELMGLQSLPSQTCDSHVRNRIRQRSSQDELDCSSLLGPMHMTCSVRASMAIESEFHCLSIAGSQELDHN